MRFLVDENFNNHILRGIQRRMPEVELLRVQDTELASQPDTMILEWAAHHGYIVLTHDVNTMRGYFYARVEANLPVPGLFLAHGDSLVGQVIDTLELILRASEQSEWQGTITYLPF